MMARSLVTKRGKSVRLEGLPEISAAIDRILSETKRSGARAVGEKVKRVLMGGALMVRDEVRDMAPQGETGNLKRGVFAAYGREDKPDVLVGMNYRIAPHAHLVEFGHGGPNAAPPHPYFRPGIAAAKPLAIRSIAEGLKRVIDEAAKK